MFKAAAKLTMDNAGQTLEAGLQALAAGESAFDLSDLSSVDSSAVAVLLEWRRQAAAKGAALSFGVLPADLQSLIDLYGVDDLLPSAAPVADDSRHR
ncbi:MAG: anti-anti-sigma regulatory factor [Herbaspirillum sp.]|jgi:phospholipid transport system transporter-binding protein|nr:anti-anti-sigma regulatory factor [Herbaspirillum sp.]